MVIIRAGWVLISMLNAFIFYAAHSVSLSTSMPPSRRRHGCFLMLMGSPVMPEVSPSMLLVFVYMLTWPFFCCPISYRKY